jgi:hypothetical protein
VTMSDAEARKRTVLALERIADALEAANASDPLRAIERALAGKQPVKQPNGKSVITPLAYRLILRDVDRLLVTVYGARRGDTGAPMYRAIAAAGQAAHEDPIGRAVAELRGQLRGEPELLKLLEGWD